MKFDLSDAITDPQSLALSGTAHVTFQNKGDDNIITPFTVMVFEDKDDDGKYTQGLDNLLGTGTFVTGPTASVPAIWPEGAGMVTVPLSGAVKFLHAPLYALIDSSDAIVEQSKTNNLIRSGVDCENRPANPIQNDIEVKWRWNQPANSFKMITPPAVMYLTDDNNDGKIDGNDIPAVVFVTGHEDNTLYNGQYGRLFALRGDTGAQLFTYYDLYHGPSLGSYVAAGDIDGDGVPEIIVNGRPWNYSTGAFLAISNTGSLKWDNFLQAKAWTDQGASYYGYAYGAAEIADVDADGFPDIISGKTVINNNGSIKYGYNYYGTTDVGRWGQSHAVDLDLDGKMEVLAGFTAYKPNTRDPWWSHPDLLYSRITFDAVGNLDDDPYPEIVMVSVVLGRTEIFIVKYDGTIIRGPIQLTDLNLPDTGFAGYGSIPVIADFDGDGEPEIGITGNGWLFILDKYGDLKRKLPIPGYNTQPHSATVFDLNGDGRPEVMVHTAGYFRIFDGASGQLLFEDSFGAWRMQQGATVVADVNGDGQAEIVVNGFDETSAAPKYGDGVRVYGTKNNNWVNSRRVWNQLGYHVTNVNDNGSIPQYEPQSWLLNNTYQCQAKVGTSANPFLTPNLTASYLRSALSGTGYDLTVRIGNGGAVEAPTGIPVTFSDGDPAAGGTITGTASTTKILLPGEYQDITLNVAALSDGQHAIYAKVDGGPSVKECNYTDNQARLDLTILSGLPDLKIGSEDIVVPSPTATEGSIVTLSVNVKNIGLADASNVTIKLSNGNPAAGGTWIGLPQTVGTISAGGTAALAFTFDTLGRAGQNILYISVDPDNAVIEATKANNVASIVINVQPPQVPNLVISTNSIQITPANPGEGEQVSIDAVITNRGSEVGNIPVRFTLGDPAAGGALISEQTIYPILGLGQSATVNATLNTTGLAGQREVYAFIDSAGTITESSKADNTASKPLFIQSAGLTAGVALDKTEYQQNEAVTATITAMNSTTNARALHLTVQVKDGTGVVIASVSQAELVAVNPSGMITLARSWNTGSTLSGSYTMSIELVEVGLTIARGTASFSIAPDKRIEARITTSKVAYYPNEAAELTAVVASNSANYVFQDLTAAMTILSSDMQQTVLKTETRSIRSLMPGAAYTFKSSWNTGINPPGAYPVNILVTNSTGSVVASVSRTLTITSDLKPSAMLTGQITLDKQSIMSSEPVSVAYTVSNIGNIDLSNVALSVKTVHVKNQTVYGTLTETASLPLATSVTTTRQIDTTSYAAMDYLVVLQASINGGPEETIAGSYFRVEGAPTAPALSAPAAGSDVQTLLPVLTVNNASDPNDDRLTYEFEVYADSGLATMVAASGGIAKGTGTTSFTVPVELTENSAYFWRSRAFDGRLYGQWMQPSTFRVNVANDPPTAPTIAGPADSTEVSSLIPTLVVNNASDPDSEGLTYNFLVALDSACTQTVASGIGIPSGQGTTSWQVTPALSENTWYTWCAQADDWLIAGPWSPSTRFFVNTANDAPTVPVIIAPVNNAVASSLNVDIVLQNSTDVDSPVISYAFEVDRLSTFDSPGIIKSGIIPAGAGTTTWQAIGLLDNTQYYVRAMASDGNAGSAWTQAISIFVNTANDAPTTPVIANPSIGAGVNVFTPTFSVHNATDLDRDALTYEFEVYSDAALTNLVDHAAGIAETPSITSWTVAVALTENQTYYWRNRAFDGSLNSGWTFGWFVVNTANDAPGSVAPISPLNGSTLATLSPTFTFQNAVDPDSDVLTYELAVYSAGNTVASVAGIQANLSGQTSVTLQNPLADNTTYQWSVRAYDGDRYGPWAAQESFTVHVSQTGITVDLEIEPETLNQQSNGNWVMAEIELPHGYNASDVDISSIRLEGTVPAVAKPYEQKKRHHDHGCDADHSEHDHGEIKVKFSRSAVIDVLPAGDHVPVHVTGTVAGTPFEGVDFIRVIH
ncbi:MAG: CARDB domain-containing protein [Nitrospirota bacterium]